MGLVVFVSALCRAIGRVVATAVGLAVFFLVGVPLVLGKQGSPFLLIAIVLASGLLVRAGGWALAWIEGEIRLLLGLPSFAEQQEILKVADGLNPALRALLLLACWVPFLGAAYLVWLQIPGGEQGFASLSYAIQVFALIALTSCFRPLPADMSRYLTLRAARHLPPAKMQSVSSLARAFADNPNFGKCAMCGRALNNADDLLSGDCGGDCWGCIGQIEASTGARDAQRTVDEEIKAGLRKADGSPADR
mgnify:CR=1 FL=1